jgi:hypothetical protein
VDRVGLPFFGTGIGTERRGTTRESLVCSSLATSEKPEKTASNGTRRDETDGRGLSDSSITVLEGRKWPVGSLFRGRRLYWEGVAGRIEQHRESRALAGLGGDGKLPAMSVEDVLDDGKPKPGAPLLAA